MMNRPARLEIMKGDYIMPLIDTTGRVPEPPMVAFKQITKGVPAIYYRADELIYWPRNRRAGHVYAASPVEQMIGIINIGMRREAAQLGYFADGNIPDALISVPAAWSPEDISRHQKAWDARMRDPQRRFGKITYIPGGGQPVYTRNDQQLFGQFDEWLARVACYCFKKPPTAFVQQNNRATAESAKEEALEDGLASVMIWWKSLKDHVAQKVFGFDDIEFVYDDRSDIDPMEMIEKYLPAIQQGGFSWDEIRGKMGMSPIGLSHTMYGMGPLGAMLVTDFLKASAQGLGIPQPAPAVGPDGMPLAASPGQPALATPAAAAPPATPVAAPDMSDPLSGVPAELLAAVGLGPAGEKGRSINITAKDEHTSDPLHRAVAHPQVLKTLRAAEAAHNAKFGGKKPDNAKGITPGKKAAPPQRSVKGSPVGVADGQKGSYAHAH
jgi:hypothetical protein